MRSQTSVAARRHASSAYATFHHKKLYTSAFKRTRESILGRPEPGINCEALPSEWDLGERKKGEDHPSEDEYTSHAEGVAAGYTTLRIEKGNRTMWCWEWNLH
jgi:hypothetical protein